MVISLTKHQIYTTNAFALHTSVFCSLIAIYTAATYWLLRFGISQNSIYPVLLVLGISLFVILLTDNLQRLSRYLHLNIHCCWYLHYTPLVMGSLLLFFLFGLLIPNLAYPLMLIIAFFGYVFFLLSTTAFLKTSRPLQLLVFLVSCLLLAIWISSLCWAFMSKPIFFESIAASSSKLWLTDTLYHLSMTQMIKTYHVPSTGMDGIPYMKYHFGSHWWFAMLSNLLKMSVLEVYTLAYPVIFPPLMFQAFFYFILEVRGYLFKNSHQPQADFIFWFFLLAIFIGFTKTLIAGNPLKAFQGADVGLLFFSESYLISIFYLFASFALILYFYRNQSSYSKKEILLFYLIFMPVLLSLTGLMKVSTMYVMAGLLGYFFLRLRLYTKGMYIASMVLLLLSFVLTYYAVIDFSYTEGGFAWLYFFNSEQVPLLKFFSHVYLWAYLFLSMFIIGMRLYSWQRLKQAVAACKTLAVEATLVTVLLGLLPVSLLILFVANALYFTELNLFVAGAFFLAYLPLFTPMLERLRKRLGKPLYFVLGTVVFLWAVVIWQYNARGYMNVMIGANIIDRKTLVKDATSEDVIRQRAMKALARLDAGSMLDILEPYGKPIQAALDSSKAYRLLVELGKLDALPVAEKQQSLVYMDLSTVDPEWQVRCYNIPFIVPAISGIASLNGMLYSDCGWNGGYGFEYYSRKDVADKNKSFSIQELCAQTKAKGFLYLYTYDGNKNTFVKTNCQF
jgi:hypothetical protein